MGKGGLNVLTSDLTMDDVYNFLGVKPSKYVYLATVSSDVQTQLNTKLGLGGAQALTANITASTADTYTFLGAKPSKIAYMSGISSGIQTQLNGKLALTGNQTLGGNITCTTNPSCYMLIKALLSEVA